MPSKGVLDRHRVAKALVAAARTHAQEVGERLQEVLAPFVPEGETLPDLSGFQLVLADYLEAQIDAIVQADELHLKELDDDQGPRRRRDEATDALHDTMVALRETLIGAFGAERAGEIHGIDGRTSRDPLTLFRQASRMLERLNDVSLALPPARLGGVQLDLGTLAGELQPALDELAQALGEVDREIRESETTIREKDIALDDLDNAVSSVGRVLTGFDDLAGLSEFSDKLRLSLPARRRREGSPEEDPSLREAEGEEPSPGDRQSPLPGLPASTPPASGSPGESGP